MAEAKRAITVLREVSQFAMELFVKGEEEPRAAGRREAADLCGEGAAVHADEVPVRQAALEALFKSTGGADCTNKTGWMTDAELGDWHGVEVTKKLELHENGVWQALSPTRDIQQLFGFAGTITPNTNQSK